MESLYKKHKHSNIVLVFFYAIPHKPAHKHTKPSSKFSNPAIFSKKNCIFIVRKEYFLYFCRLKNRAKNQESRTKIRGSKKIL